jgi:hypothetical protein
MPADTVREAVQQSSEAAVVIDKIAGHLGEAAGVLGAKVTQIIDAYGPNAAMLIREAGRIQAFQECGYFVISLCLFIGAAIVFGRAWSRYDTYVISKGGSTRNGDEVAGSYGVRLMLFGIITAISLIATVVNFKLAALYGIFSPEAFLVIKLLKW